MKIAIERTDGGVSIMQVMDATADLDKVLADWKAVNPGRYVRHVEITDTPAGKTGREYWRLSGSAIVVDPAWTSSAAQAARVITAIQSAVQARLDTFAQTRRYDGILSACTYATSTVPQFRADGQYCVQARDATWAKCTEILTAVQAGTRPLPGGYADIEPELPVLVWPA